MTDTTRPVRNHASLPVRYRQKARNLAQGLLLLGAMAATAALLAWLVFGRQALPWVLAAGLPLERPIGDPLAGGMDQGVERRAARD